MYYNICSSADTLLVKKITMFLSGKAKDSTTGHFFLKTPELQFLKQHSEKIPNKQL